MLLQVACLTTGYTFKVFLWKPITIEEFQEFYFQEFIMADYSTGMPFLSSPSNHLGLLFFVMSNNRDGK